MGRGTVKVRQIANPVSLAGAAWPIPLTTQALRARRSSCDWLNLQVRIDHVNMASLDFEATAKRLRDRLGLGVEPFPGRTGGHVPLAERQYIEIHTPASPTFGDFIARVARNGDRWWTWSVEVAELPTGLSSARFDSRDGSAFTQWWGEHAGASESATARGFLPYFIRYETDGLNELFEKKRIAARHDVSVGTISRVVVGPDPERLERWLGATFAEVHVDSDSTGIASVAIEVDGRQVVVPLS